MQKLELDKIIYSRKEPWRQDVLAMFVPETKNITLEELEAKLKGGKK